MAADFKPELGAYKSLKPFVFWAQATLPTVFDDSLSYYESVSKLAKMVNTLLENVDTTEENIEKLAQAYDELQGYVNTYFDNLDVQNEINNKLDTLAEDGTLSDLIEPFLPEITRTLLPPIVATQIGDAVAEQLEPVVEEQVAEQLPDQFVVDGPGSQRVGDWLEEHISTPSTVVIDNSLTVDGAAADAGATGRAINNIREQSDRVLAQTYDVPIYSTGTPFTTLDPDTGVVSAIDPETAGVRTGTCRFEVFGGGKTLFSGLFFSQISYTGYAFYDKDNEYISGGYYSDENLENIVNVPANAYYCIAAYKLSEPDTVRGSQYITNFPDQNLQEIIEYLNDFKNTIPAPDTEPFTPTIVKGSYIGVANGKSASSAKYARTDLLSGRDSIKAVNFASADYEFVAIFYDTTGNLSGSGFLTGYDYTYGTGERVLPDEAAFFALSFRRRDQTNITDADVAAIRASLICVPNIIGELNEIERRMENHIDLLPRKMYGTITTNGGIGSIVDLTPNPTTNYIYVVYQCKKGDVFQIAGSGGSMARLWCITDNNLRIISVAAANRIINPDTPYILTAAQDGYLIFNHFSASETSPLLTVTTLVGGHSDEAIVEIIQGVTADDISKVQKIDRFIFSRDIKDTFLLPAALLPEHPWDDDNGVYSSITATQMYAQYDALVEAHPEELTAETIGTASDGTTPIKAYRFTPAHVETSYRIWRPKIMVNCATHGWEKCGTETMLLLLKILFEHWDSDPLLEVLRWDVDWVIVPVSNPYGFDHNTRKNANGVDINRNYAPGWAKRVTNPSSQTYQGEAALSEPESIAINALMVTEKPDIGIDFHDFGQSTSRLSWVGARPGVYRGVSINSYHLAQVCQDKTNRRLVKAISFLSGLNPTTLGKITDGTYPLGLTADAYYYNGAKFAYTFETCGMLTIDPEAKRFSDAHALICIDEFANFVAQNLQQLYRVDETFDVVSTSDEPEPEPEE